MGSQYSSDLKYVYTTVNGNEVSIPYVRLANDRWVPLHQQNWYTSLNNHSRKRMRLLNPNNTSLVNLPVVYPIYNPATTSYFIPNQAYYSHYF